MSGIVQGAYRRYHDTHSCRITTGWLGGADAPLWWAELWQPRQHAARGMAESAPAGGAAGAGQDAPGVRPGCATGTAAPPAQTRYRVPAPGGVARQRHRG